MERPTLRQLEYAVAVADHQHFGRAAEAVAVSQPGLSGQIQELERRLGVTLFERSSRGVTLTPAGVELIARSRAVLRDVDELVNAAGAFEGELKGRLRVGAIPTVAPYLLPATVQVLRQSWPELILELDEEQTHRLVDAVEAGSADLGLLALPVDTGSLRVAPIVDEAFVLTMPETHALAGTEPVDLQTLADVPVLLMEDGHCLREHALSVCATAGGVEHSTVHAASLGTLAQMVASGLGVTLLPASSLAVETRPGTGLSNRRFEAPEPVRTIGLVWRPSDPRSASYELLVERLRDRFEGIIRDSLQTSGASA